MNARELFEWAIRAEVKREWKIDGFGAVSGHWIGSLKKVAGTLAFRDPSLLSEGVAEAAMATLLPMKAEMEEIAAKKVAYDEAVGG
jgi:hypothetical protein